MSKLVAFMEQMGYVFTLLMQLPVPLHVFNIQLVQMLYLQLMKNVKLLIQLVQLMEKHA